VLAQEPMQARLVIGKLERTNILLRVADKQEIAQRRLQMA
jgi:hypothetical protein